jgi:hypothetical protein
MAENSSWGYARMFVRIAIEIHLLSETPRTVPESQDADNEHHVKNHLLEAGIIGLLGDYHRPHGVVNVIEV